jgi:hypothetical protein
MRDGGMEMPAEIACGGLDLPKTAENTENARKIKHLRRCGQRFA